MSRVENIESQISELSSAELTAFREWFAEFDASVGQPARDVPLSFIGRQRKPENPGFVPKKGGSR
jgi:hypothetical protein